MTLKRPRAPDLTWLSSGRHLQITVERSTRRPGLGHVAGPAPREDEAVAEAINAAIVAASAPSCRQTRRSRACPGCADLAVTIPCAAYRADLFYPSMRTAESRPGQRLV